MPERFLIVRLSALGDTALTLPLLFTLRRRFPQAHIGWVVEEKSASLLQGLPGIDRLHIWRMSEKTLAGAWRLAREIRAEKYDCAFDAQGLTKSAIIPFLARINKRVGFRRAPLEARELAPLLNNRLVSAPAELTHIALRTQYLAQGAGIEPPYPPELRLPLQEDALHSMRDWWAENVPAGKTIIYGVGTSWPTKIWPVEHMAHLLAAARERGWQAVVTWGPDEQEKLPQWREILGQSVLWSPPTKSVSELAALLSLGQAYAGPDSAPLHLAWLLGKPTFSWFGPSDSKRGAPVGATHRHIVAHPPTRQRHGDMLWCLSPQTVLPEFIEWLQLTRQD